MMLRSGSGTGALSFTADSATVSPDGSGLPVLRKRSFMSVTPLSRVTFSPALSTRPTALLPLYSTVAKRISAPYLGQLLGPALGFARLDPGLVVGLGLVVGRIDAGDLVTLADADGHELLEPLLLEGIARHLVGQMARHHDGAVVVGHDHVAGIDRHAADTDRRLHLDRMQVRHAGRRRRSRAIDREVELGDHRRVAHRAVAQHARHAAHLEAQRQDVAQGPRARVALGAD